jgi:hypothetical protein
MSLNNPFPVFGIVTENSLPVDLALIFIKDTTNGSNILTTSTNNEGMYIIDIQDIADNNGDEIKIWASKNGKHAESTFTLDISGPAEEQNLGLTAYITKVSLSSTHEKNLIINSENETIVIMMDTHEKNLIIESTNQ